MQNNIKDMMKVGYVLIIFKCTFFQTLNILLCHAIRKIQNPRWNPSSKLLKDNFCSLRDARSEQKLPFFFAGDQAVEELTTICRRTYRAGHTGEKLDRILKVEWTQENILFFKIRTAEGQVGGYQNLHSSILYQLMNQHSKLLQIHQSTRFEQSLVVLNPTKDNKSFFIFQTVADQFYGIVKLFIVRVWINSRINRQLRHEVFQYFNMRTHCPAFFGFQEIDFLNIVANNNVFPFIDVMRKSTDQ